MKDRSNLIICVVAFLALFTIIALNTLYKVSSRSGVAMFSREVFVAGMPYWIGIGVAFVLGLIFFVYKRMNRP